ARAHVGTRGAGRPGPCGGTAGLRPADATPLHVDRAARAAEAERGALAMPTFEVLASGFGLAEAPTQAPDGSLLLSDVLAGGVYGARPGVPLATVIPKR